MAKERWGGQGKVRSDGAIHWTLWRNSGDGDRGERLSWDQHNDGRQEHAHHTDQGTGRVSWAPRVWRQD